MSFLLYIHCVWLASALDPNFFLLECLWADEPPTIFQMRHLKIHVTPFMGVASLDEQQEIVKVFQFKFLILLLGKARLSKIRWLVLNFLQKTWV